MNIYQSVRDDARKLPNSQFLQVPLKPSLGMALSALNVSDVFRPGDRLKDYFISWEVEHSHPEDRLFLPECLVSRFGKQDAFCLQAIADTWSHCLTGVEVWMESRKRNPRTGAGVDDLIYFVPDRCPEDGYPRSKEETTPEHEAFARCSKEPFAANSTSWYGLHKGGRYVAPKRLPSYAAGVAKSLPLTGASFLEFSDMVDWKTLPFVPLWTKVGAFIDEEREELILAAIWRGCVAWLLSDDQGDDVPFPDHEDRQAIIIANELQRHDAIWRAIPDFFKHHPYSLVELETHSATLVIATGDGRTSFSYKEIDSPYKATFDGVRLDLSPGHSNFATFVRMIAGQKIASARAKPLFSQCQPG
jgi:hypothetical protein